MHSGFTHASTEILLVSGLLLALLLALLQPGCPQHSPYLNPLTGYQVVPHSMSSMHIHAGSLVAQMHKATGACGEGQHR